MTQGAEQEIVAKGYAHPDASVETEQRNDSNVRMVPPDEDVRNYDGSRIEWNNAVRTER